MQNRRYRVCDATQSSDSPIHVRSSGDGDHERCSESDEHARGDIDWIVDADEDAVEADAGRDDEKQHTEPPMEHQYGEGDGKGDTCVIARKRVVSTVMDKQHGLLWMVSEGPRVIPEVSEGGVDE